MVQNFIVFLVWDPTSVGDENEAFFKGMKTSP